MLDPEPPPLPAVIPLRPWLADALLPFPDSPPVLEEAAPDGPAPDPAADKAPPPEVPGGGWQWVRSRMMEWLKDNVSNQNNFMLDSMLLVNGLNFVLSTLDHHLACQIFLFLVYDKLVHNYNKFQAVMCTMLVIVSFKWTNIWWNPLPLIDKCIVVRL